MFGILVPDFMIPEPEIGQHRLARLQRLRDGLGTLWTDLVAAQVQATKRSTHLLGNAREQPAPSLLCALVRHLGPFDQVGGLIRTQAMRRHPRAAVLLIHSGVGVRDKVGPHSASPRVVARTCLALRVSTGRTSAAVHACAPFLPD